MFVNGRWVTYRAQGEGGGGGGGGAPAYEAVALDDAFRASDPALKDFKNVGGLRKAYLDTKALVGASIRPPGPEATPEARKEFLEKLQKAAPELVLVPEDEKARAEVEGSIWQKLGRPKDGKDYSFDGVQLEPGVELNQDELRTYASKLGLTKAQAKELFTTVAGERAAALRAAKENQAALKKELGAAYDERLGGAAAAAGKLGASEAVVKALREGTAPADQVKLWIGVAKAIGADKPVIGNQGGGAGGGSLTPAEAKARSAELRQRPEYWDRSKNPALSDQLRSQDLEYQKLAHPEEG